LASPYFVSRDAVRVLSQYNIEMMAPDNAMAYGDIPNLPPGIIGTIRRNTNIVVDLAGDKAGALVLGYLTKFINPVDLRLYMVINPYRPFSWELQDIAELKAMLECFAQHPVTGMVSNPHLAEDTDFEVIVKGHRHVQEIAAIQGIPLVGLTVTDAFYHEACLEFGEIVKQINLYLRPDWL
jgi:hypothetical protein